MNVKPEMDMEGYSTCPGRGKRRGWLGRTPGKWRGWLGRTPGKESGLICFTACKNFNGNEDLVAQIFASLSPKSSGGANPVR